MQEQIPPAGSRNFILKLVFLIFTDFIFSTSLYRDNKGQTPYVVAPDKDTRSVFRKYMGENPEKYDYSKAQVRLNWGFVLCV